MEKNREERLQSILNTSAELLEAEGTSYFIGIIDRQQAERDGGQAYAKSNTNTSDMCHILDLALPTRKDLIEAGKWLGSTIYQRGKKRKKL